VNRARLARWSLVPVSAALTALAVRALRGHGDRAPVWAKAVEAGEASDAAALDSPTWPPLEPRGLGDTQERGGTAGNGRSPWVPPVDGACPPGYPVKAKLASHVYHVPGGSSYARTTPDRCYASGADAEADGFRAAKR